MAMIHTGLSLPHGYGVAAIDPPDEKIPWCNCDHDREDHHTIIESIANSETGEDEYAGESVECYGSKTCECTHFEESDGIDPRF